MTTETRTLYRYVVPVGEARRSPARLSRLVPLPVASRCAALAALAGLVIAGAVGCESPGPPKLAHVTENVDQPDVPVPHGFTRRPHSSWTYDEFPDLRSWQTEYIGDTSRRQIVDFYRESMPEQGWILKSAQASGTKNRLLYGKGNAEEAVIEVFEAYDQYSDAYRTVVKAEIHPTGPDALPLEELVPERPRRARTRGAGEGTARHAPADGGALGDSVGERAGERAGEGDAGADRGEPIPAAATDAAGAPAGGLIGPEEEIGRRERND